LESIGTARLKYFVSHQSEVLDFRRESFVLVLTAPKFFGFAPDQRPSKRAWRCRNSRTELDTNPRRVSGQHGLHPCTIDVLTSQDHSGASASQSLAFFN
jgi:hypothetical protein